MDSAGMGRMRMKAIVFAAVILFAGWGFMRSQEPQVRIVEKPNGDYRLVVTGGRRLVCEEQPVTVAVQPDAVILLVSNATMRITTVPQSLCRRK